MRGCWERIYTTTFCMQDSIAAVDAAARKVPKAQLADRIDGLQHKGTMSTKPVFDKIATVIYPVMWT